MRWGAWRQGRYDWSRLLTSSLHQTDHLKQKKINSEFKNLNIHVLIHRQHTGETSLSITSICLLKKKNYYFIFLHIMLIYSCCCQYRLLGSPFAFAACVRLIVRRLNFFEFCSTNHQIQNEQFEKALQVPSCVM